ncbi:hypothetical protein BBH99_15895 [Chryseobacterium contaminans]|uniref:Uncharacterized protein n=1 Tax=Chryseobacterium contaminans TaxID=1423959 RepID=A0A1M6Y355_9FLAO|nr:hypothetical protein [Chryseobacterium contaminans]OCA80359.1 hypothetical protein BBH99_15895 [Chryseobacterium contaminans]SHL12701.1 hypothetical protein SAMN05444407_102333 [Chryseobacterium contaminans]
MGKENLKEKIEICIVNIQQLATTNCWNKISSNFVFIVSDFNEFEGENFFERRKSRNKVNKSKIILSLDLAIDILDREYQDLYDVNLYIFKANKKETIIEIQYYRKSNLASDYLKMVKDNEPMYHAKILKPYYVKDSNKFDVNWESGGLRYLWNHFLAQIRYRINTFRLTI